MNKNELLIWPVHAQILLERYSFIHATIKY